MQLCLTSVPHSHTRRFLSQGKRASIRFKTAAAACWSRAQCLLVHCSHHGHACPPRPRHCVYPLLCQRLAVFECFGLSWHVHLSDPCSCLCYTPIDILDQHEAPTPLQGSDHCPGMPVGSGSCDWDSKLPGESGKQVDREPSSPRLLRLALPSIPWVSPTAYLCQVDICSCRYALQTGLMNVAMRRYFFFDFPDTPSLLRVLSNLVRLVAFIKQHVWW